MFNIFLPSIKNIDACDKQILNLEKYRDFIKNKGLIWEKIKEKDDIKAFLNKYGKEYGLYLYSRYCVIKTNFGKAVNRRNGNEEEQFYGILVQNVLAHLLNKDYVNPEKTSKYGDGGRDYIINNCIVDVKNTSRNVNLNKYFVFNLFSGQVNSTFFNTDFYILTSLNKKEQILTVSTVIPRAIIPYLCKKYNKNEYSSNPQKNIGGDARYEVVAGLINKDFGVNSKEDIIRKINKKYLTNLNNGMLENTLYYKISKTGKIDDFKIEEQINYYIYKDIYYNKKEKCEISDEIKNKIENDYYTNRYNININRLLKKVG